MEPNFIMDYDNVAYQECTDKLARAGIHETPAYGPSPPKMYNYTQEPQSLAYASDSHLPPSAAWTGRVTNCRHCRALHQQEGIAEMVGQYNPDKVDPSAAMMNLAVRGWDSKKLDYGCKLLQEGYGQKAAAREVCCWRLLFMAVHGLACGVNLPKRSL